MRKDANQLRKLLLYILARRPDEFGLVPDVHGFVRIKDLIKAVTEESGWAYVRKSHIDEVMMIHGHDFLLQENGLKACKRYEESMPLTAVIPPKILYHCIRRKAYPVVLERGIFPMGQTTVHLATSEEMAFRMGKRRDPKPVLLAVQAQRACDHGVEFWRQGRHLFFVNHIPVGCFRGPPPPQDKKETKKGQPVIGGGPTVLPGSFILDMTRSKGLNRPSPKKGQKKEIDWKKDARKWRRKRKDR